MNIPSKALREERGAESRGGSAYKAFIVGVWPCGPYLFTLRLCLEMHGRGHRHGLQM